MNRDHPKPGDLRRSPKAPEPGIRGDAVVLAGGRGQRLGRRKESVPLGGMTFLDHHITRWSALFDRVWVSAREPLDHPLPTGVEVILDPPAADSVIDALAAILRRTARPTWIVAVDLPAMPREIPETLFAAHAPGTSVFVEQTVPEGTPGLEMLCGLYDPQALPAIEELIASGVRRLSAIAAKTQCKVLHFPDDFPPLSGLAARSGPFYNVNTPLNLEELEGWLAEGESL